MHSELVVIGLLARTLALALGVALRLWHMHSGVSAFALYKEHSLDCISASALSSWRYHVALALVKALCT
jgi:hypothetical protein